ncbi:hypothetical protein FQN49_008401 [Arthroderma sp. PD_2]|nr:hypothetical protein FQN49_008401 [Arthroderma sp. PD_2]
MMESSSLSGGAIAGIVVGAVAFLALAALGLFFFLKRRNQNRDRDSKSGHPLVGMSSAEGAETGEAGVVAGAKDKKYDTPQEMDAGIGQQAPAELPESDYPPQELPADVPPPNR